MPRPSLVALDAQRHAITQRALAGSSTHNILAWLHDSGVTASLASLKRRLKEWREADALQIGRRPSSTDEAVQSAILELFARQRQRQRQHRCNGSSSENRGNVRSQVDLSLSLPLPSDEEIREALEGRFRLSCRQIREVRLRHQIRRREKRLTSRLDGGLVEALLERCTAAAAAAGSGESELPKDDELVLEMRAAGFETCEREVRAIRRRHGIKHACRGANRHGQRRAVLHTTPSVEGDDEDDEDDDEGGGGGVEEGDVRFSPASKLVQDRHFTVVTFDAEATSLVRQIAKPVSQLVYDNVGAGLRRVRKPLQVATIAQDLLHSLNVQPPCSVTSMYVSNHYIVPDTMFGIWVIPLVIHVESERVDDDDAEEEAEELFVNELLVSAGHDHLIDDHAVRIGQAIYLTKPAAVHMRLTVLILSRSVSEICVVCSCKELLGCDDVHKFLDQPRLGEELEDGKLMAADDWLRWRKIHLLGFGKPNHGIGIESESTVGGGSESSYFTTKDSQKKMKSMITNTKKLPASALESKPGLYYKVGTAQVLFESWKLRNLTLGLLFTTAPRILGGIMGYRVLASESSLWLHAFAPTTTITTTTNTTTTPTTGSGELSSYASGECPHSCPLRHYKSLYYELPASTDLETTSHLDSDLMAEAFFKLWRFCRLISSLPDTSYT